MAMIMVVMGMAVRVIMGMVGISVLMIVMRVFMTGVRMRMARTGNMNGNFFPGNAHFFSGSAMQREFFRDAQFVKFCLDVRQGNAEIDQGRKVHVSTDPAETFVVQGFHVMSSSKR